MDTGPRERPRVALIEAGSPGLNIYSHVAMGRGVPLLATVVRGAGYDVRAFIEDISGKGSVDWGFVASARVVGFSAITCTLPRTSELLARVRVVNPAATIVLGGPEPTCAPERGIGIGADYVLRGEAEHSLPRLLDIVTGREPGAVGDVPGIVWAEDGGTRFGPAPRQLTKAELDALPSVDRSLVHEADAASVAGVWRSRGCPLRCGFCEVHEIWPRYTRRSDALSVREIIDSRDAGYSSVFLVDDNAAADGRDFKEFLRALVDHGFTGGLTVQLRAESILDRVGRPDRELLRLLKRAASFTLVCVGVESASDEDLAALGKRTSSSRMARALKAVRRSGVLVHGMFMALPGDTREAIRRNGAYARRYVTSLQYLFEVPLPGTKRTRQHERAGRVLYEGGEDLALYDGMHVVVRPERMSPSEMQRLVTREYERFYSVGRIVGAALRGAFLRFRVLTAAQRRHLARLPLRRRIRAWTWFHIEYKFAPVAFLAVGRNRVRAFMRDMDYLRYLSQLETLSDG